MDVGDVTLRGVATTVGYLLVGTVGTAIGAVGLLVALQPVRPAIYRAYYLAVGPWSATETSSVLAFAFAALTASAGVTMVGVAIAHDVDRAARVGAGLAGGVVVVIAVMGIASYAGSGGLLAALAAVAVFIVAVPVAIGRLGGWTGGAPAFVGSVPVVILLVLLLGFGLGWGGGYDVVAREVPSDTVTGPATTFEGYPQVRDDLLSPEDPAGTHAYCQTTDGRRTCRLPLRGYGHEAKAVRFLAEHGVRCRFQGASVASERNRSFVARADGSYYRIRCVTYGD